MAKTDNRQLNPGPGLPPVWPSLVSPAWEYVKGGYKDHGHVIPTIAGMAIVLGVTRAAIHNWGKEVDEFVDIVSTLLATQEQELISNGLAGNYNPSISKLILTKHGYSDKIEQEITGNGINLVINKTPKNEADSTND